VTLSTSSSWLDRSDALAIIKVESSFARWANRAVIFFLALFALAVPHSIAAAQISLGLSLIASITRDLSLRKFHFKRTPIDLPLFCFITLTLISSVFSIEPSISMPKLKSVLLFGVIYLIATNLRWRGAQLMAALMIVSSLVGVGFSLSEKLWGRGMMVTSIAADSPLNKSELLPGDVIWMIARQRVFSLEKAASIIRKYRAGEILDVEALHGGDPVPVKLRVTDELKARPNPLGISVGGRSRQFRISGFSRQFQTYAEQMQILGLLAYGGLLTSLKYWQRRSLRIWLGIFCLLFALFGLALALTASRAVIASFVITVLVVSILTGGRLVMVIALITALALGGLGLYIVTTARQQATLSLKDNSAERRIAYMQAGLRVIPRRPLLGVGMDSHKRHWKEWGFPGEYITHTHSTPIQIAMDRGIPALGCYLWLVAVMTLTAWRGYKYAKEKEDDFGRSLMLGVFGALIGFSLSSLANYNFGDSEALMLMLSMVGLVVVYSRGRSQKTGEKS
jgi:hypothetical protein